MRPMPVGLVCILAVFALAVSMERSSAFVFKSVTDERPTHELLIEQSNGHSVTIITRPHVKAAPPRLLHQSDESAKPSLIYEAGDTCPIFLLRDTEQKVLGIIIATEPDQQLQFLVSHTEDFLKPDILMASQDLQGKGKNLSLRDFKRRNLALLTLHSKDGMAIPNFDVRLEHPNNTDAVRFNIVFNERLPIRKFEDQAGQMRGYIYFFPENVSRVTYTDNVKKQHEIALHYPCTFHAASRSLISLGPLSL